MLNFDSSPWRCFTVLNSILQTKMNISEDNIKLLFLSDNDVYRNQILNHFGVNKTINTGLRSFHISKMELIYQGLMANGKSEHENAISKIVSTLDRHLFAFAEWYLYSLSDYYIIWDVSGYSRLSYAYGLKRTGFTQDGCSYFIQQWHMKRFGNGL